MKPRGFALLLAVSTFWAASAGAADYAALEGKELYAGATSMVFIGEDANGNCSEEFLSGVTVSGLLDDLFWKAFWGKAWGEDAMLAGGSLDYFLAHNFDDYCIDVCQGSSNACQESLPEIWWFGAGPTIISHRDMLVDDQGIGIDGEEFGLNIGAGYHWDELAMDMQLHYFPGSDNALISCSLVHSF